MTLEQDIFIRLTIYLEQNILSKLVTILITFDKA